MCLLLEIQSFYTILKIREVFFVGSAVVCRPISNTLSFVNRDMTRMNFLSTPNVDAGALRAYKFECV